ncbi:porin PorA family protein [Chloroflexota bacterium]
MGFLLKKRIGIVLAIVAAALIIFGAVWVTVIFPGMEKLPGDLNEELNYQATVSSLDFDTYQVVTFDAVATRTCQAVENSGDTILIAEDVSFIDSGTGQVMPWLQQSELMAVDRVSRTHVAGSGDMDREGAWMFPLYVKEGQDYPVWISGLSSALNARYIGEEDFRGLNVYAYEIGSLEEGFIIPAGTSTPRMRLHEWISVKVEPDSGTAVYYESVSTRTAEIPIIDEATGDVAYTDMTVYANSMVYTDETIQQQISDAKHYKGLLSWGNTYLPWLVFGLGAVMGILGAILIARRKITEMPEARELSILSWRFQPDNPNLNPYS